METCQPRKSIGSSSSYSVTSATPVPIQRERQLIIPHSRVKSLASIDWHSYKARGFRGVVLDVDNTITLPYETKVHAWVRQSLVDCKSCFSGQVALYSNSAGLQQFDPQGEFTTFAALERHGALGNL